MISKDSALESIELQNFKILNLEAISNLKKLKSFSCISCEGIDEKLIPSGLIKRIKLISYTAVENPK